MTTTFDQNGIDAVADRLAVIFQSVRGYPDSTTETRAQSHRLAFEIGSTLAALGDARLMSLVFEAFASRHETEDGVATGWLDAAWNGVTFIGGGCWTN